jgi:hypothetical protein
LLFGRARQRAATKCRDHERTVTPCVANFLNEKIQESVRRNLENHKPYHIYTQSRSFRSEATLPALSRFETLRLLVAEVVQPASLGHVSVLPVSAREGSLATRSILAVIFSWPLSGSNRIASISARMACIDRAG